MNAFELRVDVAVIVETNLGTHRPDCIHVGQIAAAYSLWSPARDRVGTEEPGPAMEEPR